MSRIQIKGTEKLDRLVKVLEEHGDGRSIKNGLRRAIRGETGAITRDQQAGIAASLPHRGGLAETLASQGRFSTRSGFAGKSVAVDIVDSWKGHDMKAVEAGSIRHPVFGRWLRNQAAQSVKGRLLSRPVLAHRRGIQRRIIVELDKLAAEIAKET